LPANFSYNANVLAVKARFRLVSPAGRRRNDREMYLALIRLIALACNRQSPASKEITTTVVLGASVARLGDGRNVLREVATMIGKTKKKTSKAVKAVAKTSKVKAKTRTKTSSVTRAAKPKQVVLLSGGNPQIAKADGDAPVQAYIAALPGWKSALAKRLDALIVKSVPRVRKAVKWNSPFYGVEGQGYFLSYHAFARYLKVAFFRGTSLQPVPPGTSKNAEARYLDIHESDELDEAQLKRWLKQAAALPGWDPSRP
jgi:hypothetical protein